MPPIQEGPLIDQETEKAYHEFPDRRLYPEAFLASITEELSSNIRGGFLQTFHESIDSMDWIPSAIQDKLKTSHDLPAIEVVLESQDWRKRLKQYDFAGEADQMLDDEAIMILRLPEIFRPYELYLKEHGSSDRNIYVALERVYRSVINAIWAQVRSYAQEYQLQIERVNQPGIHDNRTEGYYYIFRIAPTMREMFPPVESDLDDEDEYE